MRIEKREIEMIKNIISDLGNVVLEFNPISLVLKYIEDKKRAEAIAKEIFLGDEWYRWDRNLITKNEISEYAKSKLLESEFETVDKILNSWWDFMVFNEDILDFYEVQKSNGMKLYILSNYSPDYYELKWNQDRKRLFDGEIISCDFKVGKPNPEIYKILLQKYDLNAAESLFIDDIEENLQTAKKLGFKTLRYHLKENTIDELIEEFGKILE